MDVLRIPWGVRTFTQVKTMERPEEPVRHNVVRNGKRDGAKAERSEKDT